ncbi:KR domain protein [Leptospira broomii serovar Hurstbridge str. 5399]|uniref:KR domain protein n=1 Tax=Leptospira broomii serovar Hurstbridge str. 5399 TaxID=1049789 RepID=T0FAZ9_9LEPT|nr:SDR family oxidoreductase [Leptospira broomii]EQA45046.1 KR domain protein [Leptospira broomii serovar Hurstbridge str. 5399]
MNKQNWKDRFGGAALITGASGGLGETFARRIAAKGLDLVLVARRKEELERVAKELRSNYGIRVETIAQDLSAEDAAEKVSMLTDQLRIPIGLLINNAGFGTYGYFEELDSNYETKMVNLNCRTPVAFTGKFLPAMKKRGKGGLVFLASIAAYQPTPFFATYGATKAFNLLFGEALWAELRGTGVQVISLSPGYTKTKFQENAGYNGTGPFGIWSTPEEVVDRCLSKLGDGPSTIPGFLNRLLVQSIRFTPRNVAALASYAISKPR